jgi:type IV pilus assembly protein PilV
LLVTVAIFSIGLLSIAALQTVSKSTNFEAMQRTSASQVAHGLLEDMRVNGDGAAIYLAAGELGNGSRGTEPAPNCTAAAPCNAAQLAAHDLWLWEQVIDGNLETVGGAGTGGLVLPALCVTGPAGGGAGIYVVTITWRGTASITNTVNNPCGATGGKYGTNNEFRRIIQVPTFIDPNA